jgi:hypothetical protein
MIKTIKINIPDWLYRYRWKNIKKYALWLVKPNRCSVCGTKTNYLHPEIQYQSVNNSRLLLQYSVIGDYRGCVCSTCVANIVHDDNAFSKSVSEENDPPNEDDVKQLCDCCAKPKKSYKWVSFKLKDGRRVGLITGREWWNGFYFCVDCLRKALQVGTEGSNIYSGYTDKNGEYRSVPQNNFGLPVVNGKVRFPR